MAVSGLTPVDNKSSSSDAKISSIQDLEKHPEFFPVWMEEIQRRNLSSILSATSITDNSDTSSSDSNSLFGVSSGAQDSSLSSLGLGGLGTSSDPMASIFGSQGITSDFSFMNPTSSLQSVQVAETLKGLQNYSNTTEAKKWLGQLVTYMDPADKLLKQGKVTKIDIENVNKPLFRIDDKVDVTLDDIKQLNVASGEVDLTAS